MNEQSDNSRKNILREAQSQIVRSAFFALAAGITLLIMLRGTGASGAMLVFFVWFVIIPLAMGLAGSYALYRRDYAPPPPPEEPWKKYTNRR